MPHCKTLFSLPLVNLSLAILTLVTFLGATPLEAFGQANDPAHTAPVAATAATVIPALVRYSGVALRADGKALSGASSITFLIFKDQAGGEPLWAETQTVGFDPAGHYEVYLGAGNPSGLPADLFGTGEARWLEVQVAGEPPQPRVLLVSVPYALKAADAATLGGLPASAFVLAGSQVATLTTAGAAAVSPDASSTVTTTGGTKSYIPIFTGTNTIASSEIYDTGTSVGIGVVPNPSARLDVGGGIILRGGMTVSRTGNATSSKAYPSYPFGFYSNVYNSSTKGTDNPHFLLQSEPVGNNTSSTGATFNLLYSNHGSTPAETGLSINSSGVIQFASGQTFPGSSGSGTISGVKAGTDLTGGGTSGAVTLNLDTTKVPTLAGNPVFTGTVTVNNSQAYDYGVSSNTTGQGAVSVYGAASGSNGVGVEGAAANGGAGVAGGYNGTGIGYGVFGYTESGEGAGVFGVSSGSRSQTAQNSLESVSVGVWGDAPQGGPYNIGVFGTTDTGIAGSFTSATGVAAEFHSGTADNTVTIYNSGSVANGGDPVVLFAQGQGGYCDFDSLGSLYCTGSLTALNETQAGTRQVETYAVQSAESWLEDAGTAELHSGVTHVDLEPVFSQTVNAGLEYHVFLTPNGDCKGLYVSGKSASGFDVHELGGGTSSIAFDYRIMAKRIGHENERLVDVTERKKKQLASQPKLAPGTQDGKSSARRPAPIRNLSLAR